MEVEQSDDSTHLQAAKKKEMRKKHGNDNDNYDSDDEDKSVVPACTPPGNSMTGG